MSTNAGTSSVIHETVMEQHRATSGGSRSGRAPGGRHLGDERARHTVVVSDVHLSQAHPDDPTDPLWMRYRTAQHHPDAEFEALVERLLVEVGNGSLELVFNGDLFDFDAPWVKDGESSFDEFSLDDAGCAAQVERIMADHPGWFRATARALVAGHRVLFLSGNHDVELYWPGVRDAIRRNLEQHARALDPDAPNDLGERIRFRAWFHVTEDRIYLEHGSQYDMLNGVPDPMLPLRGDGATIHPVCGKLAFKRTGSRMGYFNPYHEETFYMGLFGYLSHYARCYATSERRHIVRTWASGAFSTCLEIWRHRTGRYGPLPDTSVERACAETGATPTQVQATHSLAVTPAERTMIPILRELWVDRTLLASFVLVAVAVAALAIGPLAALFLGAGLVLAFVVYERVTPKPDIRTYDSAPPAVRRVLDIHDARAMCLGHTHRASGTWGDDGRFVGNSGTWSPAFEDQACEKPVHDARPLLWLRSSGDSLSGGLYWWKDGSLVAGEGTMVQSDDASHRARA